MKSKQSYLQKLFQFIGTIKELTEELDSLKQNTVENSVHESIKTQIISKDAKIKQLKSELESRRDQVKLLQNKQDLNETGNKDLINDLNEKQNVIEEYKDLESDLQEKKDMIKHLKVEVKDRKLANARLTSELERVQNLLEDKSQMCNELEYHAEELKKVVEHLEDKKKQYEHVQKTIEVLENEISERDQVISNLRDNLKNTVQRLSITSNTGMEDNYQSEIQAHLDLENRHMTFLPKDDEQLNGDLQVSLANLITTVRNFLETADPVEVNEIKSIINNLIDERLGEFQPDHGKSIAKFIL